MSSKLNKLKQEAMPFFIMFVLIDVIIGGTINHCLTLVSDGATTINTISVVTNNFMPTLTSFKFFAGIFENFSSFLNITGYTFVIMLVLFIAWKIKNSSNGEYDNIENGSSDWAKNGEEFNKTSDGREILNRKRGFILSKDHYLGTDLKKVLINKNILVVGRIWCW